MSQFLTIATLFPSFYYIINHVCYVQKLNDHIKNTHLYIGLCLICFTRVRVANSKFLYMVAYITGIHILIIHFELHLPSNTTTIIASTNTTYSSLNIIFDIFPYNISDGIIHNQSGILTLPDPFIFNFMT